MLRWRFDSLRRAIKGVAETVLVCRTAKPARAGWKRWQAGVWSSVCLALDAAAPENRGRQGPKCALASWRVFWSRGLAPSFRLSDLGRNPGNAAESVKNPPKSQRPPFWV